MFEVLKLKSLAVEFVNILIKILSHLGEVCRLIPPPPQHIHASYALLELRETADWSTLLEKNLK